MSLAAYVRVSTDDQDSAMQRDAIDRYAQTHGLTVAWYEDHGVSGAKRSRPALDRLMADVRRGAVRHVVVYRFDRFARSSMHLLEALHEFRSRGVVFTSLTEGIDTGTPVGEMVYTFLAAIAQFERALITERIRDGLAAARKRGVRLGRPAALMPGQAIRAAEWLAEGMSLRQAARRLGVGRATLRRYLAAGAMAKTPTGGNGSGPGKPAATVST